MWATCVIVGMIYVIVYAKKVQKNPKASYVYNDFVKEDQEYLNQEDTVKEQKFTWRQKLTLLVLQLLLL